MATYTIQRELEPGIGTRRCGPAFCIRYWRRADPPRQAEIKQRRKPPTGAVACWTTCCRFVPMLRFEAKPGLHAAGRRSWPRAWDGRLPGLGLLRRETHDVTAWAWKYRRSSLTSMRDTPPGFFGSSCKYAIGQGVTRSAETRTIFRSGHGLRHRGQRKPHY